MKKRALLTALSFGIIVAVQAQSVEKGPEYKNAHPAIKYDGTSSVLVRQDTRTIQGPEYKNKKHAMKVKVSDDMYVSTKTETETYKKVDLKIANNKRSKLKGPAYKNYRPSSK